MKILNKVFARVNSEAATRGVLCKKVFFCEFCEISKNTFFTEHLWTTASINLRKDNESAGVQTSAGIPVF